MCGINGFTFQDERLIKEMNNLIKHRGPDSSGIYSDENVTLGHQRLKIIDLSENAAQPMSDHENTLWLVFNGEIYNFQELRKKLEQDGHKFKSESDTEVIIHAYKKWGYDCVQRFNGMWAFALYDKNKLFLSRDRLGKKPLFYTQKGKNLFFSSEIRPLFAHDIEKKLNKRAVSSFLSYRYVLGKETMFEGIFKLLPAHNMIFDISKGVIEKIWEYWDVDKNNIEISEEEAKEQTEDLLRNSVSLRQVSDVPIGSINSGGLDSSLISAIMASMHDNPINTFTVKLPERGFDETEFAGLLASHCKTNHREITIDTTNFLDIMREYVKRKDEPIGVPNEIALYTLFQEIKKYATVVLSGEGADELFAGYSRIFRSPFDYERLKAGRYKNKYPSLYKKYSGRTFSNELEHFMYLYNYFPDEEKNSILKDEFRVDFTTLFKKYFDRINGSYAKKISYIFIKLHLPGLFSRLDNSSMTSAVEARCPFVDYRFVDLAFNLPFELKNPWKSEKDKEEAKSKNCDEIAEEHDTVKYILKRIAENHIPKEIIMRKKQGFPLPLQKWFSGEFFEEARNLLLSEDSKIKMVAKTENLKKWIQNGIDSDSKDFGQRLWMLISLELWLREWF
ncbi:MAG: asparagine synthase (glutamine-hydrolyzing) [Candidatus Aenigmarchaeota archaeon]|nr:asparagine synthase (glutamine-hydrolyzing) [Candidatus Aenigmarchaeota archaeon]